MDRHATAVLEFDRLLEVVAAYCRSPAGAAWVRQLYPARDWPAISRHHAVYRDLHGLAEDGLQLPATAFPDGC